MFLTVKPCLTHMRKVPQLPVAIVWQSSGSRVAIEWLSSGNRFLQACVAGVYYVCNRCAAGHDLGVLRGTTVVSGEDIHTCGPAD